MTAELSWHVQNCDLVGALESKLQQKEYSQVFNCKLKIVSEMRLWPVWKLSKHTNHITCQNLLSLHQQLHPMLVYIGGRYGCQSQILLIYVNVFFMDIAFLHTLHQLPYVQFIDVNI